MKSLILGILLIASPATVFAINLTAADSDAAIKIRWMQGASGTDHSRLAAYVRADRYLVNGVAGQQQPGI